uniref:Mur ligase domain-containing protein n=1 Tax=Nocardia brasiliensis TaxID=37326 RepID=UPI002455B8D1
MIEMTLREIADVVGGTLHDVPDPEVRVTGSVEFDSRRIGSGDLFLALPGEHVDGHDYAPAAIAPGAPAVLSPRPVGVPAIVVAPNPGSVPSSSVALSGDSDGSGAAVLAALADLARASVQRLTAAGSLTVIGVTGSSGKTSTKDLLAAVLAPLGPVVAPPGSFNNELGHPWRGLGAHPPAPVGGDAQGGRRGRRTVPRSRDPSPAPRRRCRTDRTREAHWATARFPPLRHGSPSP